jgi:hypothetical protein
VSVDDGRVGRERQEGLEGLEGLAGFAGLAWRVKTWIGQRRPPAYVAVRRFTSATIGRSGLHQLVVFASLSAGIALAWNGVLSNVGSDRWWLDRAALGGPLTAIVMALLGIRAACLLPTSLKAAWVFKLSERDDCRLTQLNAVRDVLWMRGVVVPLLVTGVLPLAVLGPATTLAYLPIPLALGWILVESATSGWRRLPFTCTVLFGKRPAALTVVMLLATFFVFVTLGTALAQAAVRSWSGWWRVMTLLTVAGAIVHSHRRHTWGQLPLEFEDSLPDALDTLKL